MSFYQQISSFVDYLQSIRKLQNYLSFDLVFPNKWSIPKSIVDEGQIVTFQPEDENLKGISFVCNSSEEEVNSNIVKINKVIKLNKEKEIKEQLFKKTIEELKKTFETNDLEKLKKLYFDFQVEKSKKIKNEQNGEEPTTLELVD